MQINSKIPLPGQTVTHEQMSWEWNSGITESSEAFFPFLPIDVAATSFPEIRRSLENSKSQSEHKKTEYFE